MKNFRTLSFVFIFKLIPCICLAKTIIISHKGFHNLYKDQFADCQDRVFTNIGAPAENTLDGISEAFKHGADYVEFDTRLTKDDIPVIFHDKFLLCSKKLKISEFTFLELNLYLKKNYKQIISNNRQSPYILPKQLITLDDVLKHFPNRSFLLNPKEKSWNEAIAIRKQLLKNKKRHFPDIKLWGRKSTYQIIESNDIKLGGFIQNHWQSEICLSDYRLSLGLFLPKSCYGQNVTLEPSRDFMIFGGLENLSRLLKQHNSDLYFFIPKIQSINYLKDILNSEIKGIIVSDIQYFSFIRNQLSE